MRLLEEYEPARASATARGRSCRRRRSNVSLVAEARTAARLRGAVSLQAALEAFARQASSGDYCGAAGLLSSGRAWTTRRCTRFACACATRARRHDARLRAALPALDGAVTSRAGRTRASSSRLSPPDATDVADSWRAYSFGTLKQAQALGDLQTLLARGRRVIRIDLGADIATLGSVELRQAMEAIQI